jgi:ribosome-binding protein aMBF1 (putative translation factor)
MRRSLALHLDADCSYGHQEWRSENERLTPLGFWSRDQHSQADPDSKQGCPHGEERVLEDEVLDDDESKSEGVGLPGVDHLDQIPPCIARKRIAAGVSQSELARRLGVSKQVVSRCEGSECQTAAVARRQEFLDAAGVKTLDRDELQATLRVFHDRGNREWRVAERLGFQSPRQACQRFLALLPASSLG